MPEDASAETSGVVVDNLIALDAALDAIAGDLVLVDGTDLPALAALHTAWESFAAEAAACCPAAAGHAGDAAAVVEAIILEASADPAAALATLEQHVRAAQDALRQAATGEPVKPVEDESPAPPTPAAEATATAPTPTESAPAAATPAAPAIDRELLVEFVGEAEEHLQQADSSLLLLESEPEAPEALDAVFRAFHTLKGVAGFLALSSIGQVAHEAESLLDQARSGRRAMAGAAMDIAFEAVDVLRTLVAEVADSLAAGRPPGPGRDVSRTLARLRAVALAEGDKRLGEILVGAGLAMPEDVDAALTAQAAESPRPPIGTVLVQRGQARAGDVRLALHSQREKAGTGAVATQVAEAVKVDAKRLDLLVDTIGELVIAQAALSRACELTGAAGELSNRLAHVGKITRELQQLGTSLRMIPIRGTFQKMARLVRDVAKKAGKAVEFVCEGEDTELDKTVVDRIGDPLVHMVRNAVDHGLESEAQRRESGKPPVGQVTLQAYHQGGSIIVELSDDGRGLDRQAILDKAVRRGLVAAGETLTDRQIHQLIFEPGFSTAAQITEVSGRGVGMDVVKRTIESMRGQVEIRSTPGEGSTFTIRLPLTLAIIDGMVVRAAGENYIVPTASIITTVKPTEQMVSSVLGHGRMLTVQDRLLPFHRLVDLLGNRLVATDAAGDGLAVVAEDGDQAVALLVDELVGQQQVVVKGLGAALGETPGIAGGAVLPNGQVGLIIDVAGLVRLAVGEAGADGDNGRSRPTGPRARPATPRSAARGTAAGHTATGD